MKLTAWACAALLAGGGPALAGAVKGTAPAKTMAKAAAPARAAPKAAAATHARSRGGAPAAKPAIAATRDAASVEALKDSAWRVTCDVCDRREFAPYFVYLRADGQVGSNLGAPTEWNFVSWPATWRVHAGELLIEWQPGDVQTYALATLEDRMLLGLNHENQQQLMVRVVVGASPSR